MEDTLPAQKWSKEIIINVLQNIAKSKRNEIIKGKDVYTEIPKSSLNKHFGSLGNALSAAGLKGQGGQFKAGQVNLVLTDEELFNSLYKLEQKTGKLPTYNQCNAEGKYSTKPFRKRFGKWVDVLAYYNKWKKESEIQAKRIHNGNDSELDAQPETARNTSNSISHKPNQSRPPLLYGEPIEFRGLRHAPINEQGVVYLFGMVSRELGFYIEAIQQGFPDCEGKYLYDKGKKLWAKARIEFEHRASNFIEHGHDPDQCDFIVCWINDWPDSPLSVIELRSEIKKLSSK